MPRFGTLTSLDDLSDINQTVAQFGEDNLAERVQEALEIHNEALDEVLQDFAYVTNDYLIPYGAGDTMEMQDLDEGGVPDAEKLEAGGSMGLPLRFRGIAVQWDRLYMQNTPVRQLLTHLNAAAEADIRRLLRDIRNAFVKPTNTIGYKDIRQTKLTYDVRALLNGDGMVIPPGPNLETFDPATHTHYTAEASLTEAGLAAEVDNVVEHGGTTDGVFIYINRAQEAAVRGFGGFDRYVDNRITPASTEEVGNAALGSNPADRAIGLFEGAEVWVKPWVPANYEITFARGDGDDKALAIRTRSGSLTAAGGFGTLFDFDDYPLRATGLGREFGVAAAQRHKASVHFSGGATYVQPAF